MTSRATDLSEIAIPGAFRLHFGLPPMPSKVLTTLYRARGTALRSGELAEAMGSTSGAVQVALTEVRHAMDPEAIKFIPNVGYSLTPAGLTAARTAIRAIGEELLAEAV